MLLLDGAMGTMIQRYNLSESDFRRGLFGADGMRMADSESAGITLQGCNDLLSLTRPDIISDIHRQYVAAGADIISTNTFNANSVSLEEYGMQNRVEAINIGAARLARQVADEAFAPDNRRRVAVAGSMGPSNVSLSLPEVAATRGVNFDKMRRAYSRQAAALIEGGVDMLLLETIFDTLNAKAAIAGIEDAFASAGRRVPVMISATLTPQGRLLSGQDLPTFIKAILHVRPMSVGLNCGFGAEDMEQWLPTLQPLRDAGIRISLHPNAGLPDEMGEYTQTPAQMAAIMERYMNDGLIDIAGGCCGTTPEHIRALREVADSLPLSSSPLPHPKVSDNPPAFLKVGERCNVAGSRKFLRLINEGNISEAVDIAAAQIDKGAAMIDVNMDDAMLDAPAEMENFISRLNQDSRTSTTPIMIDSSDMEVISRALRIIPERPTVNSISLKEGEDAFLSHAEEIRRLGADIVVMAFDEQGQATTLERKIEICRRAYSLLTEKIGFKGEEIIFDPNILTIATGMAEHDRYALDFLEAISRIKETLPGARVSGGVSNLSFAFRGNNRLREAIHAVFLHHAIARGMDMAIVNPSTPVSADAVAPQLREAIEDLIFMRRPDATERLMAIADSIFPKEVKGAPDAAKSDAKASPAKDASSRPPVAGNLSGLNALNDLNLDEALREEGSAMGVVTNRLMKAMRQVGDDFGAGRIFLPQVVRAAGVMKRAIDRLTPLIEAENTLISENSGNHPSGNPPFVLATVKGDVHDIGKNIVAVILRCSGFDVIDLGVMVEEKKILETLRATGAKFLGLSGLITPSLKEMERVAAMLERERLTDVTLCVGGATTGELHTAVKIAPLFDGLTLHTRDAALLPVVANRLANPNLRAEETAKIKAGQAALRDNYAAKKNEAASEKNGGAAKKNEAAAESSLNDSAEPGSGPEFAPEFRPMSTPRIPLGIFTHTLKTSDAIPLINWRAFLHTWRLPPALAVGKGSPEALEEANRLIADAKKIISAILHRAPYLKARAGIVEARSIADAIEITALSIPGEKISLSDSGGIAPQSDPIRIPTPRIRDRALADYVAPHNDFIGLFCATAAEYLDAAEKMLRADELPFRDEYASLLIQSTADRLAEAATELLHTSLMQKAWGADSPVGIRPAIGYPSLPDQRLILTLAPLLRYAEIGVTPTENGALHPSSTTAGLILPNPKARNEELGMRN